MSNTLSFLSLCRKALKLKMGFDSVEKTLKDAFLVIYASDISPKTMERMEKKAQSFNVPSKQIPFMQEDIYIHIGKNISVMSITDEGLAEAFLKKLKAEEASE